MNKFIGLASAFAMFIALSCSVNAYDDPLLSNPQPMERSSTYCRYGQFSHDYYENNYGTQRVHLKPSYRPVTASPYDRYIPQNIIKSIDDPYETNDIFGTKPKYTPINNSPYYNQNIPKSVLNNSDKSYGTYPWNVKYTYTPASQIKYTPINK
jgi:hypothetical protein